MSRLPGGHSRSAGNSLIAESELSRNSRVSPEAMMGCEVWRGYTPLAPWVKSAYEHRGNEQ